MRTALYDGHTPPRALVRRYVGTDNNTPHVYDQILRPPTGTPADPVTREQEKHFDRQLQLYNECHLANQALITAVIEYSPPEFQTLMSNTLGNTTVLQLLNELAGAYGANPGTDHQDVLEEALRPADPNTPMGVALQLFNRQMDNIPALIQAAHASGNNRIQAFLQKYPPEIRGIADTILDLQHPAVLQRDANLLDTLVVHMENKRCAAVVAYRAQALQAAAAATAADADAARKDNNASRNNNGTHCWGHGHNCGHSTAQCNWLNQDANATIKNAIKGKRMNDTVNVTHDGHNHTLKSGFLGQREWRGGGNGRAGGGKAGDRNTKRDHSGNDRRGGGHSAEDA